MSTDIVNWEKQMEDMAKAQSALERPQVSTISLKSGFMSYMDVPLPGNKLLAVIVASAFENKFYSGPYDPTKIAIPECFALSETGIDMVPHDMSAQKQHDQCFGCPQAEWGSAGNGRRGKACKEVRRLAMIPGDDLKDGAIMKAPLALMSIPVTSVANWKKYIQTLAAEYSRPSFGVLTEIKVVPHATKQFEVQFQTKAVVNEQFLADLFARHKSALEILLKPYEPIEEEPEAPAPESGKKRKF
jgi:hypothetical protein